MKIKGWGYQMRVFHTIDKVHVLSGDGRRGQEGIKDKVRGHKTIDHVYIRSGDG